MVQKLFRSVLSVNRSPIRHTLCNTPFWFEKIIYQNEVPLQFLLRSKCFKKIRYGTFHFQQRSGVVLFRSRKCFESSVPSVNRSPIRYTFCHAPFHYPVQCEHSLTNLITHSLPFWPVSTSQKNSELLFTLTLGSYCRRNKILFQKQNTQHWETFIIAWITPKCEILKHYF